MPLSSSSLSSLTCFTGLYVWGRARRPGRRRGGCGGHSMRFLPLLRATLRGLDAFDSPGMAVSFVVSFCLALKGNTGAEKQLVNVITRGQQVNKTSQAGLNSLWYQRTNAHMSLWQHVIQYARWTGVTGCRWGSSGGTDGLQEGEQKDAAMRWWIHSQAVGLYYLLLIRVSDQHGSKLNYHAIDSDDCISVFGSSDQSFAPSSWQRSAPSFISAATVHWQTCHWELNLGSVGCHPICLQGP